jgi:aryl-alcohol dehydrogenase-like predicted oxidoreductase
MKYRKLGKSNLLVSEIGFGCMSLGTDHSYNAALIDEAIAHGINYFDTADIYQEGFNEETLGKALKEKRGKVVIATKAGNEPKKGGGLTWNPRREYIINAAEKSLRRLQTDHIDLLQLHGGTIDDPIDETIDAFETLKRDGKIRYYGISSIRPNVIREWVKRSDLSSVMMQYSLLDRRPEESCLSLLHEKSISVLARGTLAKGLLINKPADQFLEYSAAEVASIKKKMESIVGDKSSTAIAIGFVLRHPVVASCITGIRTHEQLKDIIEASTIMLTDGEYRSLVESLPANSYREHR